MEAYREVIAGDKLVGVIDLPEELRTAEVEVIVLPLKDKTGKEEKKKTFSLDNLPKHKLGKVVYPLDRESIYSDER